MEGARGRHYLSNYYYLHPRKRGRGEQTQPALEEVTKQVKHTEIAVQTVIRKEIGVPSTPTSDRPIEIAIQTQFSAERSKRQVIDTKEKQKFELKEFGTSYSPQKQPWEATVSPPTMKPKRYKKQRPNKQQLLLEVLAQLAYCLQQLENSKVALQTHRINFYSIFELIGGEGWDWLTEQQFTHGIEALELECSSYQIQMLYNRLTCGKDMLEYEDCVDRLFVPVFQLSKKKQLYDRTIRQILRGDRLQIVRKLLDQALNLEYFVFLMLQIMESQGWKEADLLQILRRDIIKESYTEGLDCDIECFRESFRQLQAEPLRLLFSTLSNQQDSLITCGSLQQFLFPS